MELNCTESKLVSPTTTSWDLVSGFQSGPPEEYAEVFRERYQNIISAISLMIIILLSILGNIVVIVAICKTPKLRKDISNIFLVNLSLTDLFSATLVMPFTWVALVTDEWLMGDEWCTAQCALNYCFIIVSMLTLSIISIDRHFAIVYPLRYSSIITHAVTYPMITYTWVQGFAFGAVPIVYHWVVYDYWEIVCAIDWDSYRNHGGLLYVIIAFVACFMIPAIIMIISYIRIYRTATGHYRRQSTRRRQMRRNPKQQNDQKKVIISLAVVVVSFFICNTPFCVTKVIKIFFSSDAVPVWLNFVATYFQYLASALNPFIYGIFRLDFRRAFLKLVCSTRVLPSDQNTSLNSKSNILRNFKRASHTGGLAEHVQIAANSESQDPI